METDTHPDETQEELGRGTFVTSDWREAWGTYESPPEDPNLIDPSTGHAEYEIDEIEGVLPDNLNHRKRQKRLTPFFILRHQRQQRLILTFTGREECHFHTVFI